MPTSAVSAPTTDAPVKGCAPTAASIPAGSATKPVFDLDGDGRPDTEWVSPMAAGGGTWDAGFRTASGALSQVRITEAGGTAPYIFFFPTEGTVAAIAGNDRGADLYVVADCRLTPVHNPQGQQYGFDFFGTTGTGVGCSQVAGSSTTTLVGLKLDSDAQGVPTAVTRTQVLIDGTSAHNGLSDSVVVASRTSPAVVSATEVSCGTLTEAASGVAAPG